MSGLIINAGGSSGGGLNLKVVGGTVQPTNPAENTVWVNTDTEINGYAFSATEPENPTEGMAWFTTGAASNAEMNVDKKNTVMLYPIACLQYVNGAWVSKTAKTYLNGAWKEWRVYLYNQGNEYTEITSGWTVISDKSSTKKNADSLYLGTGSNGTYGGIIGTADKIDFSLVNTLAVNVSASSGGGIGLVICDNSDVYQGYVLRKWDIYTGTNNVDVSGLSGEYYIRLVGHTASGSGTVTQLWME